MKLGLGRGFHTQSHAVNGMKIGLETQVQGQEVGEPVVRDSLVRTPFGSSCIGSSGLERTPTFRVVG